MKLLILTGDVVFPTVEPLLIGVALSLLQLPTVERQAGALQRDLFATNVGGGQVVAVIGHQADIFAFQLGAGQLLTGAAVVDVDPAAVVLVILAAIAVAAAVVDLAVGADVVSFHPDFITAIQLARQLYAAAGDGMDDIDAPCLHAAKIVAVRGA
ncbi:hypothetical protein D3C78_1413250 [compost metagenome]